MTLTTTKGKLPVDMIESPGRVFIVYHLAGAVAIIAELISALGSHIVGEPSSGHGDEMQVTTDFGSINDCVDFLVEHEVTVS